MIRAAAEDPQVERIFRQRCDQEGPVSGRRSSRAWLYKVRPWWNHTYHFHVRIRCPADNPDCHGQPEASGGEGCGKEFDWWFTDAVLHPKPQPSGPPKPLITMTDLPAACRKVLMAP